MAQQYITVWRKTSPENTLDWDFHVSMFLTDAEAVVRNIKAQGVHQYSTYPLGERIEDLSSKY